MSCASFSCERKCWASRPPGCSRQQPRPLWNLPSPVSARGFGSARPLRFSRRVDFLPQLAELHADDRGIPRPVSRRLRHEVDNQLVEHLGNFLNAGTGPRRLLVQVAVHQDDRRASLKRGLPHEQLVKDHPERVKVCLVAHRGSSPDLLGCHVSSRSQRAAGSGELGRIQVLGDPEIGELDLAIGCEHQVRRLQIPVHHAVLVRILERIADLDTQVHHLEPRKTAGLDDGLLERRAVDEFHRQIRRTPKAADRQESHDVRVAELLKDFRLALEPIADLPSLGIFGADHFHRGHAPCLFVRGPIHHTHRAGAHDGLDPERPELLAHQTLSLAHIRELPAELVARRAEADSLSFAASSTIRRRLPVSSGVVRSPSPSGPR